MLIPMALVWHWSHITDTYCKYQVASMCMGTYVCTLSPHTEASLPPRAELHCHLELSFIATLSWASLPPRASLHCHLELSFTATSSWASLPPQAELHCCGIKAEIVLQCFSKVKGSADHTVYVCLLLVAADLHARAAYSMCEIIIPINSYMCLHLLIRILSNLLKETPGQRVAMRYMCLFWFPLSATALTLMYTDRQVSPGILHVQHHNFSLRHSGKLPGSLYWCGCMGHAGAACVTCGPGWVHGHGPKLCTGGD